MTNIDPDRQEIQRIIEDTYSNLTNIEPMPFSDSAFSTLKEKISQYIIHLINESKKLSKRYKSDSISSSHVKQASDNLIANVSGKIFKHVGMIGGIFLGGAVSSILLITLNNQFTVLNIIVTVILGVIGAFMIALAIAKD